VVKSKEEATTRASRLATVLRDAKMMGDAWINIRTL
jgi:hypothetical protein